MKATVALLALAGAVSGAQLLSGSAFAQGQGGPPPPQGGRRPGGPGMRMGMSNATAKVTIWDAAKTATDKVAGYANSARLMGPPNGKQVWVVHVVTTPASVGDRGKGENVAVDAATGEITKMPPMGRPGGRGRPGGPPPPASAGGGGS